MPYATVLAACFIESARGDGKVSELEAERSCVPSRFLDPRDGEDLTGI